MDALEAQSLLSSVQSVEAVSRYDAQFVVSARGPPFLGGYQFYERCSLMVSDLACVSIPHPSDILIPAQEVSDVQVTNLGVIVRVLRRWRRSFREEKNAAAAAGPLTGALFQVYRRAGPRRGRRKAPAIKSFRYLRPVYEGGRGGGGRGRRRRAITLTSAADADGGASAGGPRGWRPAGGQKNTQPRI
ncbi:hypothetical protein EVAR_7854_1 [Eumeta japonica]|uniref:Uncharacterized protein n=1 Tax=Eumeta variegata TaxID=151549 RepID=A0A4C1TUZ9_EUMVA|nr:hypothetical protein EVAR_7854_1 [Eumeta japonica]